MPRLKRNPNAGLPYSTIEERNQLSPDEREHRRLEVLFRAMRQETLQGIMPKMIGVDEDGLRSLDRLGE